MRVSYFVRFRRLRVPVLNRWRGMFFHGDTINAMTIGGLALAVGILVDQSIVVLENIVRHTRMGKAPMHDAYDGAVEVALPILVSTITFIVVFYPIVFLSGIAKFLFTPLAFATSLALAASYLLSITLIPAYCAYFFVRQIPIQIVEALFLIAHI